MNWSIQHVSNLRVSYSRWKYHDCDTNSCWNKGNSNGTFPHNSKQSSVNSTSHFLCRFSFFLLEHRRQSKLSGAVPWPQLRREETNASLCTCRNTVCHLDFGTLSRQGKTTDQKPSFLTFRLATKITHQLLFPVKRLKFNAQFPGLGRIFGKNKSYFVNCKLLQSKEKNRYLYQTVWSFRLRQCGLSLSWHHWLEISDLAPLSARVRG